MTFLAYCRFYWCLHAVYYILPFGQSIHTASMRFRKERGFPALMLTLLSSTGWRNAAGHRHQTEVQEDRQHAEEDALTDRQEHILKSVSYPVNEWKNLPLQKDFKLFPQKLSLCFPGSV